MAIQVNFTAEQEAQLAQLATESGTDAEHLVKDAALRLLEEDTDFRAAVKSYRDNGIGMAEFEGR